jgi:thiol:disulfide interchange protein DsbD
VCELVGLAAGGRDPLQPLRPLALASAHAATSSESRTGEGRDTGSGPGVPASELRFERVATVAALERAVREARQPVMVDVYADWCVACKEIESLTFGDAAVRARLAGLTLLRVDVTASGPEDRALLKRYGLFGPPALLFFAPGGSELAEARVIGFQPPQRFLRTLDTLAARTAGATPSAMR